MQEAREMRAVILTVVREGISISRMTVIMMIMMKDLVRARATATTTEITRTVISGEEAVKMNTTGPAPAEAIGIGEMILNRKILEIEAAWGSRVILVEAEWVARAGAV